MTFIVPRLAFTTEERMSRKLSLMTIALCAALLATPAMAQQPSGKDSTAASSMAKKGHKAKTHHKKGAAAAKDTTMKKDSTKK
jgi:hypothetical protein